MRKLLQLSVTLLIFSSAFAGESNWQELAPDVAVRLISSGLPDASGKALFALEIAMPEDTRTYWRVPGQTGLPLQLDLSGSTGVSLVRQHWPLPEIENISGYLDYVYFGHTVLPLELQVNDPAGQVRVDATLGICSDICVPAQATLSLPASDGAADPANGLRIDQALADVPIAWDDGEEPIGAVRILSDLSAIAVTINGERVDAMSLIAAADLDGPLFGAPQKSPQDGVVLLPILTKTDNSELEHLEIEISFMTSRGAYQVSRTIEAGDSGDVDRMDLRAD